MMETNGKMRSSYLSDAMDPVQLPRIVRELKKGILEDGVQFNAIAFRGMSGALIAPMLALTMKKGLIVCRKPQEKSHAGPVEGHLEGGSYIIIDDFVSSGSTVKAIMSALDAWREAHNRERVFTGRSYNDSPIDYREKTDEEKLPPFICQKVFVYQRVGDQGAVCMDDECASSYWHAENGCNGHQIPVWGTKP